MGLNADWMQRDLGVPRYPRTQMKNHERLPAISIRRGEGAWLGDSEGKRYINATSSWWVNVFGHANPRINQRIKNQVDQLEHVIPVGFSHQPTIELLERLVKITPSRSDRVFYANSGSAGIGATLKMNYHFWLNSGRLCERRFVTLTNSYYGGTIMAISVGNVVLFIKTYKSLLLDIIKVPNPDCFLRPDGMCWEERSWNMPTHMERTPVKGRDEVTAIIVEPLIQDTGDMRMYHPVYLKLLHEVCDHYGVHLIHDEVAVGFGCTGTMFAYGQAGIALDFLCLSRALTGDYLSMSAALTSRIIYRGFYGNYQTLCAFLHSYTYTGSPLACATALATLDIFEEDKVIEANRVLSIHMTRATVHLADHPHVAEACQTGMVLATEMVQDKAPRTPYPWQERCDPKVFQHGLGYGALLCPLGGVVYLLSPYVITPEQIDFLAEVTSEGIDIATRDVISVAASDFHSDYRGPG